MKKFLLIATLGLLIVVIGLYITAQYFLGSIVTAGVNKFGPGITQTKVELQGATISPFSGQGSLNGLAVGNPPGWSQADAFKIGRVHIDVEPMSLMKEQIVINEITIEQPEFLYETRLVASNVGDLLKNIERAIGGREAEARTKDGKPIKLIVRKLVLKNGRVTVNVAGAASLTVPLPPIDMVDLGVKEGGITPAQLAFAIMRQVTTHIIAVATQALTRSGAAGSGTLEAAREIGSAIKGIFGGEKKKQ